MCVSQIGHDMSKYQEYKSDSQTLARIVEFLRSSNWFVDTLRIDEHLYRFVRDKQTGTITVELGD